MRLWRAFGAGLVVALTASPAAAETLQEALAAAYQNNPDLRAERARLRAIDENVPQALSGWRPSVSATGSVGRERARTSLIDEQQLTPTVRQLDVTQPLYRGGRTVAQTRQAESQVRAGRAVLESVQQTVLLNAVTAYMDVLREQANVDLTGNNEQVLNRQLEATRDRFEVGEVTRTDVAQAEARVSRASSDRVAAQGRLGVQRATYARVVGNLPGKLADAPPLPPLPPNLQEAIAVATTENPDLEAAQYVEDAARHNVRVATGALLPSVNLIGRVLRSDEATFEDSESRSDSIRAQITIPLYQSGAVESQVRQAKEIASQRRIEIEQTRRAIVESTTQAWEDLESSRARIATSQEQVRANEIALEGVRQEASVGSRTTLDVLDAEQELLDSRVALVAAERDEYVAGFRLLAAIGGLSADRMGLPVELYDPTRHYRQVRDKWWGWNTPGESEDASSR
jgi:TolC family type I secretion outer membrane protein